MVVYNNSVQRQAERTLAVTSTNKLSHLALSGLRKMKIMTSAAIGTRLEAVARAIAPALVAVYTAGLITGLWYTRIRAAVAAAHSRWIGDDWRFDQPVSAPAPAPKPVIRAAIHRAPLTVEALIAAHTQRELMAMAGTKSKRSKKQLAERILSK